MRPKYAKVGEIADRFRVSADAVYLWIRQGKIPADCVVRIAGTVRVDEEQFEQRLRSGALCQSSGRKPSAPSPAGSGEPRASTRCVAMADPYADPDSTRRRDIPPLEPNSRITVEEIAERLGVGRQTVYKMLKQRSLPGIRVGRLWIITRHAYESWERTCGMRSGAGLEREPEVTVLN